MDTKHKQDFLAWVERNNICVVDTLPGSNLRKGMMVMFTNNYGHTFGLMRFSASPRNLANIMSVFILRTMLIGNLADQTN